MNRSLYIYVYAIALVFVTHTAYAAVTAGSSNTNNGSSLGSGLVGYWPLDGKDINWTTGRVADRSTNGNVGNVINMSTTTSPTLGKIGQALTFNGSNSAVQIPYSSSLNLSGSFTFTAWIKMSNSATEQAIFAKNNTNEYFMEIYLQKMNYQVGTFQGTGQQSLTALQSNKWYHIALTHTAGGGGVYYVNGVVDGSTNETDPVPGTNDLFLGKSGNGAYPFGGQMDDVRLYNRVLSAQEIQHIYQQGGGAQVAASIAPTKASSGLVGYWTLDGKSTNWATGDVADASGNGNTGKVISMSTSTSPVQGKVGQALSFNGSGQAVDTGTKLPSLTSALTIAAWVRPQASQVTYADIWGDHQDDFKGIVMQQNGGVTNQYTWAYGNGVNWTNNSTLPFNLNANTWTHVVAVKDSTTCYVYLNGVEQTSARGVCSDSIVPATIMNFRLAQGYTGGGRDWKGSIDDVRVYNRALSSTEVQHLYTQGGGTKFATSIAPAKSAQANALLGYWTFDGKNTNWNTNTAVDSSGNGNTGSIVSIATTSATQGKIGQALTFNGASSYVSIPSIGSAAFANGFTWAGWVKSTAVTASWMWPFATSAGNWLQCGKKSGSGDVRFDAATGLYTGTALDTTGMNIADGMWHHLTCVWDKVNRYIYIDGTLQASVASTPGGTPGAYGTMYLGAHPGPAEFWSGQLDDMRIYTRALSATEIQHLYLQGK